MKRCIAPTRYAKLLESVKIGIVTATYSPSRNGVATSTSLFVQGLRQRDHDVRVFVPDYPEAAEEEGVYRLPSLTFKTVKDYPLLLPLIEELHPPLPIRDLDIVHTMHPFVAGRTALIWSRRLQVPLVFTAHTQYHNYVHYAPTPTSVTRWAVKGHVRAFAKQADLVLAPGQAMIRTLRDYGYEGSVSLLPNPVDLRAFSGLTGERVRQQYGLAAEATILIYLGRLAEEKNLPLLIEAFRESLKHGRSSLLVVGDGPQRAALEKQARGLPVIFTGAVPYERVPQYLSAADLFVTASTTEVLPMTFIESLAAGTPLLAARSDAALDLIEDGVNGFISAPDVPSLSRTLVDILKQPARLSALKQGALVSAQRYDVTRTAATLETCYEEALEARPQPLAS